MDDWCILDGRRFGEGVDLLDHLLREHEQVELVAGGIVMRELVRVERNR